MDKIVIPKVGGVDSGDLSNFLQDLDGIATLWHCDLDEENYAKLVTYTATTIRNFFRDKIQYTEGLSYMRSRHHIADSDSQEQFDRNTFHRSR